MKRTNHVFKLEYQFDTDNGYFNADSNYFLNFACVFLKITVVVCTLTIKSLHMDNFFCIDMFLI